MAYARIGVIGGTGLYSIEGMKDLKDVRVKTPFGPHVCLGHGSNHGRHDQRSRAPVSRGPSRSERLIQLVFESPSRQCVRL